MRTGTFSDIVTVIDLKVCLEGDCDDKLQVEGGESEGERREESRNSRRTDSHSELNKFYIFLAYWHLTSHYDYFIQTRRECYLLHT